MMDPLAFVIAMINDLSARADAEDALRAELGDDAPPPTINRERLEKLRRAFVPIVQPDDTGEADL